MAALPYPALPPSAQKQAVSAAATLRPALPPLTVLVPVSAVAMCVQACAYVYMRVHACVCVCRPFEVVAFYAESGSTCFRHAAFSRLPAL